MWILPERCHGRYWCGWWCHNGTAANCDVTLYLYRFLSSKVIISSFRSSTFYSLHDPTYMHINPDWLIQDERWGEKFSFDSKAVTMQVTVCDGASPKVIICFRWGEHRCSKNTFLKIHFLTICAHFFKKLKKQLFNNKLLTNASPKVTVCFRWFWHRCC